MLKELGEVSRTTLRAIFAIFTQKIFCTSYVIVRQLKMFGLRLIQVSIFQTFFLFLFKTGFFLTCWGIGWSMRGELVGIAYLDCLFGAYGKIRIYTSFKANRELKRNSARILQLGNTFLLFLSRGPFWMS